MKAGHYYIQESGKWMFYVESVDEAGNQAVGTYWESSKYNPIIRERLYGLKLQPTEREMTVEEQKLFKLMQI